MSQDDVEAKSYDLSFHLRKDMTYTCQEVIILEFHQELDTLELNADFERFQVEELNVKQDEKMIDTSFKDQDSNILKIVFSEKIKGKIQVEIKVNGKIDTEDCQGIHCCSNVVYTQFEKNFTRKAFPCIEKNSSKSEYQLKFKIPKHFFIVSNTSILSEEVQTDNQKIVQFEKTVPLPSYVIGFACGGIKTIEKDSYGDIPLSVIAKNSFDGKFILDHLKKSIELCEKHFKVTLVDMKLKKLDVVILPKFKCIAMENHGCIFLSEGLCSNTDEVDLPGLICHEVVHYWFGNYLSFPTWIKEGITTWYQFIFTNQIIGREYYQFEENEKEPEKPTEKDFERIYYYDKSLQWFDFWIKKMSREEFEKRIVIIFKENPFGYINEENFLKKVIY